MANPNPTVRRSPAAPAEVQARVRRVIDANGVVQAAKILGVSRNTLANIVGGLGVHPGTVALVDIRAPREGAPT
jgi:hypothetical protein